MNNPVKTEQPSKTIYMVKDHPTRVRSYLRWSEMRSDLGGMNPFSYKRFIFTKWNTPFCRDLTQVRYFTWVGRLFSYRQLLRLHCVTIVRIWSYSDPYFPSFGLSSERDGVSLRIQSECGKIRTRITPNTDTFYAVPYIIFSGNLWLKKCKAETK